jgi:hypothetical protein
MENRQAWLVVPRRGSALPRSSEPDTRMPVQWVCHRGQAQQAHYSSAGSRPAGKTPHVAANAIDTWLRRTPFRSHKHVALWLLVASTAPTTLNASPVLKGL